jgi:sigma-E factor negative regulatory protein RseC
MNKTIEHTGLVSKIDEKFAYITIEQISACSACHARGACSVSDVAEKTIEVPNAGSDVRVGERVKVVGSSSMGLFAVLLAFVVPFLLILASLLITRQLTDSEALSGTISLTVLIPYYLLLSLFNKKLKRKLQFEIVRENN